jgi:hypothetical protein
MAEVNTGTALSRAFRGLVIAVAKITGLLLALVIGWAGWLMTKVSTLIKKYCSK